MIQKKLSNYFLFFLSIFLVNFELAASIAMDSEKEDNLTEESQNKSTDKDSKPENLEDCMMQAESMNDRKICEREFMKTIEEFIEEEALSQIDGFLNIYSNDDGSVFFLKLDKEDLNEKFIYFSYVMNAPQGSTLTGGLPSDGKVYEFRSFKKDKIGLYQINTSYIKGDETNNIAKSSITNITEALSFFENH